MEEKNTGSSIVEGYIQKIIGVPNYSIDCSTENDCTASLREDTQCKVFKQNFERRLERICSFFKTSNDKKELADKLKDLAIKKGVKWSGPYSELVALDALLRNKYLEKLEYVKKTYVIDGSIAAANAQTTIDTDIYMEYRGKSIFADVKSLIPNSLEFFEKVAEEVENSHREKVLIEIDDFDDFSIYEIQTILQAKDTRQRIKSALISAINQKKKGISIPVGSKKINFKMAYPKHGDCSLSTSRSINPFKLAQNDSLKPFKYFNKLLPHDYSIIIYVVNPWFNKELTDFSDLGSKYYRAFARRVFCEATKSKELLSRISEDKSSTTIGNCAKQIAGILFIYDHSITKESEIYDAYFYLNPNYTPRKPLSGFEFGCFFPNGDNICTYKECDDFRYDNY